MPFINEILKYRSLSIVGLEKNTGKTECLNYILKRLPLESRKICVTSIGLDGENTDQVTSTVKPEIILKEGMYFSTSEMHYKNRKLLSDLIDISDEETSLGKVLTARVVLGGKIIISGPSSTSSLKRWMERMKQFGIDLSIIDGAFSRKSSASPSICDAMILSTGAAYSVNMNTLLYDTAFVVKMIMLPVFKGTDGRKEIIISSISGAPVQLNGEKTVLRIKGALTDGFLRRIANTDQANNIEIVVNDFTRIFITSQTYSSFTKRGGCITLEHRSKLVAVCVNPTAPSGYILNSDKLCKELSQMISLPVYDIVKNKYAEA